MSFGSNLQFIRNMYQKMTQEELAEKMGVSRQTVSKWEMDAAFPEMEKAIALSELFNCSLDDLLKEDLNSGNPAYQNMHMEKVKSFSYVRYAVISSMPEEDAKNHMEKWVKDHGLLSPDMIGWDFPVVSQEQINVYHMHGYCVSCIVEENQMIEDENVIRQPDAYYAVITIENPFSNPFVLIPNAYKTLFRYIDVNGQKACHRKDILECFEKEYTVDGVSYMDVYIAVDK